MSELEWHRVHLPDTTLEAAVRGTGDPVVVIQTAATADEFVPFATRPELAGHRLVLYHRRGYAGSGPARGPGSIDRDARDCSQLMAALGIDRAQDVVIDGADHSLPITHPAEVAAAVEAFLRAHPLGT